MEGVQDDGPVGQRPGESGSRAPGAGRREDASADALRAAAREVEKGDLSRALELASSPLGALGALGEGLRGLARSLEERYRELQQLDRLTTHINEGLLLDDVLDGLFTDFRSALPYDRIGCSLLTDDGRTVSSRWVRSDLDVVKLGRGYAAPLAGSTLEEVFRTGRPRILNDLEGYLAAYPQSQSTRLIVSEGIRSSLTCPLVANGVPVGFLFFSSVRRGAYTEEHAQLLSRVAGQLSVIVEKGRMVSELAAQKAAIERQNAELVSLNEVKSRLLGMAAHDLRNPIGAIGMAATLLLEEFDDLPEAERRKFLADIRDQTRHMLALLDDLLDVSEVEEGRVSLSPAAVALDRFLLEAADRHGLMATPKKTRVVVESCPPGPVRTDPRRLRQIVDNLVSNAVKFSPPGSTVRLRGERRGGAWWIAVEDEGPGITLEDRVRLFEHFARLSAQPTGGEKSVGLGLAITRRAVHALGGEIWVDSEPGHGARFWFTLPGLEEGLPPGAGR